MTNPEKSVSVVIPLYNHANYIESTIDSVLRQTISPREIIIIDDGSNDQSFDIVKKLYSGEKKLIVWSKPNEGAHHTINSGIYRSTSSFTAILNSDDIYYPERLEVCLDLLEKNSDVQLVCTGISFIDGFGKQITNTWYDSALQYYKDSGDLALSLINGNFLMTTSNFVVRRSAFEKIGYFKSFRYAHDLDFLLRMLAHKQKIYIDSRPLLKYRIHPSNTINEGVLKVKVELAAVIVEYLMQLIRSNPEYFSETYLTNLYTVLDKHNLSRMLFPLMGIMAANMSISLDSLLNNKKLLKNLLTIAK